MSRYDSLRTLMVALLATLCYTTSVNNVGKPRLKILIKETGIGYSHIQFMGRLADLLVKAGHTVDIVRQDVFDTIDHIVGSKLARKVWRIRKNRFGDPSRPEDKELFKYLNVNNGMQSMHLNGLFRVAADMNRHLLRDVLNEVEVMEALRIEHYDVAIGERLDKTAFVLFERAGIPSKLAVVAGMITSVQAYAFGVPLFTSFDPNVNTLALTGASASLGFWGRLVNLLCEQYEFSFDENIPMVDEIIRSEYGSGFPSLRTILRNISFIFLNSNEYLTLPRIHSHKFIYIGGIMQRDKYAMKPLDLRVSEIFETSKKGVIYFSLGTFLNSREMTKELLLKFANAFAAFPDYEIVWKFDGNRTDDARFTPNVHKFAWLDQAAILAHPKLRLFITHAGQNSVNEVARHGVPLLCFPFMFDQLHNAAMFAERGVGIALDLKQFSVTDLKSAMKRLLNDPSYAQNAANLAKKVRNPPFSPVEKFVRHVEFGARFSDVNELNLPLPEDVGGLFAYYNLDVVLFLAFCAVIALLIIAGFTIILARLAAKTATSILDTFLEQRKKIE